MINIEKVSVLMEFTFSYRKQIISMQKLIITVMMKINLVMGFKVTITHSIYIVLSGKGTYEQVSLMRRILSAKDKR